MIRTCECKLREPCKNAQLGLRYTLEACRQLYNAALEERISYYRKFGKSRSYWDQCKELTTIRAEDERYQSLNAEMLRLTVLRRLDKAVTGFFLRLERNKKPGFPHFKACGDFHTLIFGKSGWDLVGKRLWVPTLGMFRLINKPHREGELRSLQLVYRANSWWAQFHVDIGSAPEVKRPSRDELVGIDVGIKNYASLSDGTVIANPRFLRQGSERVKALQRKMMSKKRGSNNRRKARRRFACSCHKIASRRKNFIRQTVAMLTSEYRGFAVEKLDVEGMLQSEAMQSKEAATALHRSLNDAALGAFLTHLRDKAEEVGSAFVEVEAKGTTQRCSDCGETVPKDLTVRVHKCPHCGLVLDRDLNAARNIYNLGWRLVAAQATENPS